MEYWLLVASVHRRGLCDSEVSRAIVVVLLVLLVATATSRSETFPSCYEDEYAVRVVGIWDGTVNEMRQSTDDTTIYCVAVDDLRGR